MSIEPISPAVLLVAGSITLALGLHARVRSLALAGAANVLAASLLFPASGFGARHYVASSVLSVLLFMFFRSSFNAAMWREVRVDVFLALAILATMFASAWLSSSLTRAGLLTLAAVLAILTSVWIGRLLFRVAKDHLHAT